MSNPGVITLVEKRISPKRSFRVEDNLGESIHFHYNDIRIDLTVNELLYLAEQNDVAVYDLIKAEGFRLNEYYGDFLNRYSSCLIDLVEVTYEQRKLNELLVRVGNRNEKIKSAKSISVLPGNEIHAAYVADNIGYKPVIFNGGNILAYGNIDELKRLYSENPSGSVSCIVWKFKDNKHSLSTHPLIEFLFKWDKNRIIDLIKTIAYKVMK